MSAIPSMLSSRPSGNASVEDRKTWIERKLDALFSGSSKLSNILALDLEVNLLICAARSYKHETVLKPFPSTFLSDSNNEKSYNELV